jgi:hypothetical protein
LSDEPRARRLWLRRSSAAGGGPPPPSGGGYGRAAAAVLALSVLGAAAAASLSPPDAVKALVLFRPGLGRDGAFAAVVAAEGRVVWADASGELLAVEFEPGASACPGRSPAASPGRGSDSAER